MKGRLFALVGLVALAVPAFAQVTVEHDEFKGVTVVTISPIAEIRQTPNAPALEALAGKEFVSQLPEKGAINIGFMSESEDWQYLKCYELLALADGAPVELGESTHAGDVGDGYVIEHVRVHINLATLTALVNAKVVKFKLCNTVIQLTQQNHDDLVQFLFALTGKAPAGMVIPNQGLPDEYVPLNTKVATTQPIQAQAIQDSHGVVTAIDGDNVYISLGKVDGVNEGNTFGVFADEGGKNKLGMFTVKKVLGDHLASGTFHGNGIKEGAWVRE